MKNICILLLLTLTMASTITAATSRPKQYHKPKDISCCTNSCECFPGSLCHKACCTHQYDKAKTSKAEYHCALRPYACCHRVYCSEGCALTDFSECACAKNFDIVTQTENEQDGGHDNAVLMICCKCCIDVPCATVCAAPYCLGCLPCIACLEALHACSGTMADAPAQQPFM